MSASQEKTQDYVLFFCDKDEAIAEIIVTYLEERYSGCLYNDNTYLDKRVSLQLELAGELCKRSKFKLILVTENIPDDPQFQLFKCATLTESITNKDDSTIPLYTRTKEEFKKIFKSTTLFALNALIPIKILNTNAIGGNFPEEEIIKKLQQADKHFTKLFASCNNSEHNTCSDTCSELKNAKSIQHGNNENSGKSTREKDRPSQQEDFNETPEWRDVAKHSGKYKYAYCIQCDDQLDTDEGKQCNNFKNILRKKFTKACQSNNLPVYDVFDDWTMNPGKTEITQLVDVLYNTAIVIVLYTPWFTKNRWYKFAQEYAFFQKLGSDRFFPISLLGCEFPEHLCVTTGLRFHGKFEGNDKWDSLIDGILKNTCECESTKQGNQCSTRKRSDSLEVDGSDEDGEISKNTAGVERKSQFELGEIVASLKKGQKIGLIQGYRHDIQSNTVVIDVGPVPCDTASLIKELNLQAIECQVQIVQQNYQWELLKVLDCTHIDSLVLGVVIRRKTTETYYRLSCRSQKYSAEASAGVGNSTQSVDVCLEELRETFARRLQGDEQSLLHVSCGNVQIGAVVQKTGLLSGTTYGYIADTKYMFSFKGLVKEVYLIRSSDMFVEQSELGAVVTTLISVGDLDTQNHSTDNLDFEDDHVLGIATYSKPHCFINAKGVLMHGYATIVEPIDSCIRELEIKYKVTPGQLQCCCYKGSFREIFPKYSMIKNNDCGLIGHLL